MTDVATTDVGLASSVAARHCRVPPSCCAEHLPPDATTCTGCSGSTVGGRQQLVHAEAAEVDGADDDDAM